MLQKKTGNHASNCVKILGHPYRILINGGFGSGKINALLHLIKQQDNYDYCIINKTFIC